MSRVRPRGEAFQTLGNAFDKFSVTLLRDGEHSKRERVLVRDLQAALTDLATAIQQQRVPDGDRARLDAVALQSSILRRSLVETGELVLSEHDMVSDQ